MTLALQHLALVVSLALFHLVGPVPADLGVHDGALPPCAAPAHCARFDWPVSDPDRALASLLPELASLPRTEIVTQQDGYLHATVSSALFGFVDDLELYADRRRGLLQARSQSRLGDSDLGVNGRRLLVLQSSLALDAPA